MCVAGHRTTRLCPQQLSGAAVAGWILSWLFRMIKWLKAVQVLIETLTSEIAIERNERQRIPSPNNPEPPWQKPCPISAQDQNTKSASVNALAARLVAVTEVMISRSAPKEISAPVDVAVMVSASRL